MSKFIESLNLEGHAPTEDDIFDLACIAIKHFLDACAILNYMDGKFSEQAGGPYGNAAEGIHNVIRTLLVRKKWLHVEANIAATLFTDRWHDAHCTYDADKTDISRLLFEVIVETVEDNDITS